MSAATLESVPAFRRPSTSESSSNGSSELNGHTVELISIQDPNGFNKAIIEAETKGNEETKKKSNWFVASLVGIVALGAIAMVAIILGMPFWLFPAIFLSLIVIGCHLSAKNIDKHDTLAEQARKDEFEFRTCENDVQTNDFKNYIERHQIGDRNLDIEMLRKVHAQFRMDRDADQSRGRLLGDLNQNS